MTACLEAAYHYLALGLHPIPVEPRGKRPLIEWKRYQVEAPLADELATWWSQWPDANVGLVLGRGLFAVDLDGPDAEGLLETRGVFLPAYAPRSQTGHGWHVLLATDRPVADRIGLVVGPSTPGSKPAQVDIRGVGFIVAPPSVHPTGHVYRWAVAPDIEPPPAAPPALSALLQTRPTAPVTPGVSWILEALQGVGEGQRDATCTRLAGMLIGKGLDRETVTALLAAGFAARCRPPFPLVDVRKCVESIAARHAVTGATPEEPAPLETLASVLDTVLADLAAGPPAFVRSPFPSLNRFLGGGFLPGELVYLGARPGAGKTALALILATAAAAAGQRVAVVSREMTLAALGRRILAQHAHVFASVLRAGDLDETDWTRIRAQLPRLRALPLWLTDRALSIEQVSALLAHPPAVDWLIVDYLQLLRGPREIRDRRLEIEHVSKTLKTLAMAHHIPVLCLSSLSRPIDRKETTRPTLASLRESGELEHDADIILSLWRTPDTDQVELTILKARDGSQGSVQLRFDAPYVSFEELSPRME